MRFFQKAAYKKYRFDAMFAGDDHIDEKVYIESTRILKEKFGVDTIYVKRNDMSSSKLRKCAYDIYKINEKLYDQEIYKLCLKVIFYFIIYRNIEL